jgi:hypothetical protein
MREIFSNDSSWIREGILRLRERHAVLGLIFEVLLDVPFEAGFAHGTRLAEEEAKHHIKIWLYIWLHLLNLQPLTLGMSRALLRVGSMPWFGKAANLPCIVGSFTTPQPL